MPIPADLRGYADTALDQGRQTLGQVTDAVSELGSTLMTAVEPYLTQARSYGDSVGTTVAARAETRYDAVRDDERVVRVLDSTESVTRPVVGIVQERVVAAVLTLTRRGSGAAAEQPAPEV